MPALSPLNNQYILLADDDKDDCFLFEEALDELSLTVDFTTVSNGEQLMQMLRNKESRLPDTVFLDLNMPRKNGFECLSEIKQDERLKHIRIIIFSTSFDQDIVDMLYQQGAWHCMHKPNEFSKLKVLIQHALSITESTSLGKI